MATDFRYPDKMEIHATVSGEAFSYIAALAQNQNIGVSEALEKIIKRVAELDAVRPEIPKKHAEILARWESATDGPWWFDESAHYWRLHGVAGRIPPQADGLIPEQIVNHQILKAPKSSDRFMPYWPNPADGEFIAHAWEDVRDLLAMVSFLLKLPKRIAAEIYDACPTPGEEHAGGHCDFEQCSKIALDVGRKVREEL